MEIYGIRENNCYKVSFNLVNEDGNSINLGDLDTLKLTLFYYNSEAGVNDKHHLEIINSRANQNVVNINNVSVSMTGSIIWYMQAVDNVKLDQNTEEENHCALFAWTWDNLSASQEIFFNVKKVEYSI